MVVAITHRAVLVVDPETKDFLEEFPYSKVVTWGCSEKTFVVVTGDLIHQRKVYFKTTQGKEMGVQIKAYVNAIMESMEEAGAGGAGAAPATAAKMAISPEL